MLKQRQQASILFSCLFLLALFAIENLITRDQSMLLFLCYITAFSCYVIVSKGEPSFKMLVGIGIVARLLMFISLPNLSDDIYRFIWDGNLLVNGIHPFEELPSFYLDKNIPGLSKELFYKLNSQAYFTIYPPINQFIFWLAVSVGSDDWLFNTNVIRLILLAADLFSLYFLVGILKRRAKTTNLAMFYFLNPLVILEFVGNVHFEGIVVCLVLGGIYLLDQNRIKASLSLGLSIGTKLLPLIFLPYLFLSGLKNKKWVTAVLAGMIAVLTIAPMLSESFINGMSSSVSLYFQKFEFNASIYFISREIGFWIYGYNAIGKIGPLLSVLSIISILGISIFSILKRWSIEQTFLLILTSYLLFSTTVHPWYILPLVAYGILSGYYFPIVWSLMIFITYLGYNPSGFELPMLWVVFEYLIVIIVLFFELKSKKWVLNPI